MGSWAIADEISDDDETLRQRRGRTRGGYQWFSARLSRNSYGFVGGSSVSELRRNEVVGGKFMRLCEEVSIKSRRATRVILMAQILTRVQTPVSLSRA
ncbi:hypothetical protein YC2023_037962 [Brassica napus]